MKTQVFHHRKIYLIFKKSSKRNQNPSRYDNSITNLKFQHYYKSHRYRTGLAIQGILLQLGHTHTHTHIYMHHIGFEISVSKTPKKLDLLVINFNLKVAPLVTQLLGFFVVITSVVHFLIQ